MEDAQQDPNASPDSEIDSSDVAAANDAGGEPATAPAGSGSLPNKEEVLEALRPIVDPELNLSIVDLGLIYDSEPNPDKDGGLLIKMTLTSPACPVGPQIMGAVHATALKIDNVQDVDIQLVWTPPWDPRTMATEDVRMMLGIWE